MIESIARIIIFVCSYILIIISLIPLIRRDNWIFRIFEYPRAQKVFINLLLIILFLFLSDLHQTHHNILLTLLICNGGYLLFQIWPYTVFSGHQLKKTREYVDTKAIRLLIFNVYQENRDVNSCLRTIQEHGPDVVLLVETDKWWKTQLDNSLLKLYKYTVSKPLDNTYGMMLYSRLELINPKVKFLVEDDIPSIHTEVQLTSGEVFRLFCLHPKPPVPTENARSTERDAEILLVAKQAKASDLPVIVAGDLNDVAWSYTTELFLKTSELLDPRRGRGFFSTFHANHWFLRWPLDHVFCSKHFQLNKLQRLPQAGSDHFPILIELVLHQEEAYNNSNKVLKATRAEKLQANKKIEKTTRQK
ncbi:endonuclease/exonuclease/phosphatase family protein [Chryseosolibacter indicus]|uniref:Endonuclease/exonuclease/phosphatase family protein n=1 Tax=Chryseosolibacter indicus TaxID=2782351 RepID=A0ABS5VRA3_9BACT|nr:endonuclease/exonuclease/phosphatase family protein [Chryseosolibacter indicus]MBT1703553.1 endonuclease/exonuclease/phosphatase family protein [Chryseosolibacter indicus]